MDQHNTAANVLITGASGFLASNLLLILDTFSTIKIFTSSRNQPRVTLNQLAHHYPVSFTELSLEDLQSFDTIIHCAATGLMGSERDSELCMTINCQQTYEFFQRASKAGVKRIYSIGSMMEYGKNLDQSLLLPSHPLQPDTQYAKSKALLCDHMISAADFPKTNLLIRHIRLFFFYGTFEPPHRLYPQIIKAGIENSDLNLTAGNQIRDFSSATQVATRLARVLMEDLSLSAPIQPSKLVIQNDGSGIVMSVKEFVQSIHNQMGFVNQLNFGAISQARDDSSFFVPDLSPDNHLHITL